MSEKSGLGLMVYQSGIVGLSGSPSAVVTSQKEQVFVLQFGEQFERKGSEAASSVRAV